MLISTKGRYALRVMVDLAEHQSEGFIPLKVIAERQEISEKYLESIIKLLVKATLLNGVRGKGGGYRLTKSPDQYTVGSILRLTEESLAPVACLEEGAASCPRMAQCRTLPLWQGLNQVINDYLDNVTIVDLVQSGTSGNDYVKSSPPTLLLAGCFFTVHAPYSRTPWISSNSTTACPLAVSAMLPRQGYCP